MKNMRKTHFFQEKKVFLQLCIPTVIPTVILWNLSRVTGIFCTPRKRVKFMSTGPEHKILHGRDVARYLSIDPIHHNDYPSITSNNLNVILHHSNVAAVLNPV